VSRVFCRFQVADLQFAEQMGEGVLPGSSFGRDGEGGDSVFVM